MRLRNLHLILALAFAVPLAAQQKPIIPVADYAKWETIGTSELSPDGRWIAYAITRVDGDDELRIREIAADSTIVVKFASRPLFSSDGRWLAYSIGVSESESDQAMKAGSSVQTKLGLLDLRAHITTIVGDVASFEFSGDGGFISMRAYPPRNSAVSGVDLVVRHLGTGTDVNFGNITVSAWRDQGAQLAMVVDAAASAGNGVRLFDPRTGVVRILVSDTASYTSLQWRKNADDLIVVRTYTDALHEDAALAIGVWRGLNSARTTYATFDPATRASFPNGHRIVDSRPISWSADGHSILFGIREWLHRMPADTSSQKAGVEIWHPDDIEIIPEQKVLASIERSRSDLAIWHIEPDQWVRLGDDIVKDVNPSDGRFAIGISGAPYDTLRMFGPVYRDLYAIDMLTGQRTKFAERVQYSYGVSPGGRYMLYVRDGHYWTYDAFTGRHVNITASIPTSFINRTYDQAVRDKPPYGNGSWTVNDRAVLLYDEYDIWEVRPDGSGATNMTQGAAQKIRSRRFWLTPDERIVDLTKPVFAALYGERTKKFGYSRLRSGRVAERLLFVDKNTSRLQKASAADVYAYRAEGFDDSPDLFVADATLANPVQVSNTNPFQANYAWGRAELVDFRNSSGQELQAALLYPANYEPGRKYPMIVYVYEMVSNTLHTYNVPSETNGINPTVFTQNGYFVLRPDIVYRGRDPGVSAVETILPAIDRVVAMGMIDTTGIGIIGHSWGAYQAAYAVTQSSRFKAAVAGAPLTDLISMYLSVYWNSGGTDARMFEIGQARMEVPPWDDLAAYMRNSPVFHVQRLDTPLLIAFGDKDGSVDWHQGIELYNAARRAGKDVVMLVYEGENHTLSRKPNQKDYHRRINEWFDHYLKRKPAPAWILRGERAQIR
jgi:dipeptidyl aminopeptidase/acylaminoacyl peptidase